MAPILHRWRNRAAALAAMAVALPLAACGGGKAAGPDPNSLGGRLQAQILALESAQQENARLMGQALAQNAQMRDDVATTLVRVRELEQRLAALEARVANQQISETPPAASPAEDSAEPPRPGPRRTPVAVRMPAQTQANPR